MATLMPPPPQVQRQLATRSHGKRIALIIGVVLSLAIAACVYLFRTGGKSAMKDAVQSKLVRPWVAQTEYTVPEKPATAAGTPPVDRTAEEMAKLRNDMLAMKQKLDELDKRKTGTTIIQNKGPEAAAAHKPPPPRPATMLFLDKADLKDTSQSKAPAHPEYVLAAWATYLPCTIQPLMNSDVPGHFTAKINQNVYDTKTGQHLLVPQGSTIGGTDRGEVLLFGNERLPTFALALTIEDRTYELETMPVTDHLGTNGLTGDVDNHWWRLFGAIFIGGALRGGQQLLQQEIAQAGGAGQVASGIAAVGNQVGQQRVGRALDTRPTIRVFAGQQCNVLLTKPLTLPTVWQGGPSPTPVTATVTPTTQRRP